jgi:isocitrate/isopropylmalate dehydrogenase
MSNPTSTQVSAPVGPKDTYHIVMLPGDGIGVEVADQARALIEAVSAGIGVRMEIEEIPCGGKRT